MPPVPLVDAHLHLWDPSHFRMPWLDGNQTLDQTYTLPEFYEQTAGIAIDGLVYVQVEVAPAYGLAEARWATARTIEEPRIQAIVAWAPLEFGEQVIAYLDALIAISPRIKGVRRLIQGEPDPQFCLQPRFVRGVQLLAQYGLSCDLCITHEQLGATIALVAQCPEVAFVLDHCGKPPIRAHELDPWRGQISELAAFPNVSCKISGLVTEADHHAWTTADLAPYARHCLAAFGEDRVMFGGDWPVALEAASYQRWVNSAEELTADLTPAAQSKFWAENARRFYRFAAAGF